MSKKETIITAEEWLKALTRQYEKPANSFTAEDLGKLIKLKRSAINNLLREAVKNGELTIFKWKKITGGGSVNCYVPTQKNSNFSHVIGEPIKAKKRERQSI